MLAARSLAVRSALVSKTALQRRSAQTVPRFGSEEAMKADALAQLRARLAYQKELLKKNPHKSHAEEVDEMWKWVKISFMVGFPICLASALKDILFGAHHHEHEGPKPDYMKIRTKPFPWKCGDCDLFDQKCWDKCKLELAAEGL